MRRIKIQIGMCALFLAVASGCGRYSTQPVPLPPMDMVQEPGATRESSEYHIQAGDLLRVKFLYHPELDVKVPVRPDGDITLQVAGQIHAAGLTTGELEKVIKERSSDRLRDPEISIMVAQLAERKVYVGGEVRLPGFVAYHEGMSPLQAIMDRGGFTDTARMDSVLRLSPTLDQGTRLDLTKALSAGVPEGTQLVAGDVLFVPRSFIGDVDTFVRMYIREVLPIPPRVGAGTTF